MPENGEVEQVVLTANATSSQTGTFYFAYGSNLSPWQMSLRLKADPSSSKPVAIARLDAHAWIICQRGYANVVALPANKVSTHQSTTWGVLYNLAPEDEARLDLYEGHDNNRNPTPELNPDPSRQQEVPYLQGNWDYNKHYLPMTVTKWLRDPSEYGLNVPDWKESGSGLQHTSVRGLVYVDEQRTQPGKVLQEYIGRMNRAIREGIALGLPHDWIEAVMRKSIPAGIEVDDEGYVGTDEGYVEAEATETDSNLKEKDVREQGNQ